jgi:hypothetical protein
MSAASAASDAVLALRSRVGQVRALQEWYEQTGVGERWLGPKGLGLASA